MAYSFTTYLERIKKFGSVGQTVDDAFLEAQKSYIRDLQKRLNNLLLQNDLGKTLLNDKDFAGIEETGQWDGNLQRIVEAVENLNRGDDAAKKAAKADLAKKAGDQISKFHSSYTGGVGGQSIMLGERATKAVNNAMPALDALGAELDDLRTFQNSNEANTARNKTPVLTVKEILRKSGKMTIDGIDAFADADTNTNSWQLGFALMKARTDMQKFINEHRSEAMVSTLSENGERHAELYTGMDNLIKAGVEFPKDIAYLKELWPSYKKLTKAQLDSADNALILKMKSFVNTYATAGEAQAANSSQRALPNVPRLDSNSTWTAKERQSFYAMQGYLNMNSPSTVKEHLYEAHKTSSLAEFFNGRKYNKELEEAAKFIPHMKEAFKLKNAAIDAPPVTPEAAGKTKSSIRALKEVILANGQNRIDIELDNNLKDLFLAEQVRNMAVTAQKTAQALAQNDPEFAAKIGVPPEKLFSPDFVDGVVDAKTRTIMKTLAASPPEDMEPGQIKAYKIIANLPDKQIKAIQSTPSESMPYALTEIEKAYAYKGTDKSDAARYDSAVKSLQTDIRNRAEFFGKMLEHGPDDVKKSLREITTQLKQLDQYKGALDKHILIDYLQKLPVNGQMGTDGTDPIATICKILPRLKDSNHIKWDEPLMKASWFVDDLQMSVSGMTGPQGRAFAKSYTKAVLASDETKTNVWNFENFYNKYVNEIQGTFSSAKPADVYSNYKLPSFIKAVENATATFKNYVEIKSGDYAKAINESLAAQGKPPIPDLAQKLNLFANKPDKDGLLNDNDQQVIALLKAHRDKIIGINFYVFDYIDRIEALGPVYPQIQNRIMASRLSSYEEIENKTDDDIENNLGHLLAKRAIKRFTGKSSFDAFNPKDTRIAADGIRAIDKIRPFFESIPKDVIKNGAFALLKGDPEFILAELQTYSGIPGFEITQEDKDQNGLPADLFNEAGDVIGEKLTEDSIIKLQKVYASKLAQIEDQEFKDSVQKAVIAKLPPEKQQLYHLPEIMEQTGNRPLPFIIQLLAQIFNNPVFVKEVPGGSKIRDKLSDVSSIIALANENKTIAAHLTKILTPPKDPAANAPPPPPGSTETVVAEGTTQTSSAGDAVANDKKVREQFLINSGLLTPKQTSDGKAVAFNENKELTEKTKAPPPPAGGGSSPVVTTRPTNS